MKMLKTMFALTLCLLALPSLAKDGDHKKNGKSASASTEMSAKDIRQEKRRFTKVVRSMDAAKNNKENKDGYVAAYGKFDAK